MEITFENIKYQLDTENKTAKVIGYKGEPIEVIIPEFIRYRFRKYKVTSIGNYALSCCNSLTSITIPNSVTIIEDSAFCLCNSLTSITIPNSVTIIEDSAFCLCNSLTSITIPNSVTSIGLGAFSNCSGLTSVTIGNSITSIGLGAFAYCTSLTSVNIPNSVTEIGNWAFALCKSLTSVSIPDSVTKIGNDAFLKSPFKEVRIPKNCTEFYGFDVTVNIIIDENNPYYFNYQDFIFKFIDNENICLFKYQGDDSEVQIPEIVNYKGKDYKVIEIGNCAFYYCQSLTSVTIPDSVTSIGNSAFAYCESLTSITIPNSGTSIGKHVFCEVGIKLPKKYTEDGRLIAYKAFNADMTCRDFQYEEGKSYELEGEIKCCECGFHSCTNSLDVFNYYRGEIGKDIVVHEVYLSGTIDEDNEYDSKVCASKIEIGRRLTIKDINEIINNK